MADEARPDPGKNKSGVVIEPAAPGWDPYEVWLTRIRPHQHLIGPPIVYRYTRDSTPPGARAFSYVRSLAFLFRIQPAQTGPEVEEATRTTSPETAAVNGS